MNTRSDAFLSLRPEIQNVQLNSASLQEESFQNQSLRPILKLQNNLLILVLKQYFSKHKNTFYSLGLEKRMQFIENALQKDIKFRNLLKGMVVGCFTEEEYKIYIQNSSALNKRIMSMLLQRYQSQIQLFESP